MKNIDLRLDLLEEIIKRINDPLYTKDWIVDSYNRILDLEQKLPDGSAHIALTQGQYTIVDAEDLPMLRRHSWFATKSTGKSDSWYARTKINGKTIPMHKLIFGEVQEGNIIDHADNNSLNNRRNNLREVNVFQSMQNRRGWKKKTDGSNYKGVHKHSKTSWRAIIKKNKITYDLGSFKSEIEAAKAYDKKAQELHGEYAVLNFKHE